MTPLMSFASSEIASKLQIAAEGGKGKAHEGDWSTLILSTGSVPLYRLRERVHTHYIATTSLFDEGVAISCPEGEIGDTTVDKRVHPLRSLSCNGKRQEDSSRARCFP